MLTITDYVKMLLRFRDDPEGMHEYWSLPIRTWFTGRATKPTLPNGELVHCGVCKLGLFLQFGVLFPEMFCLQHGHVS